MSNEMRNQPSYQIDCECKGTGRITRYIGHPNRVAIFVCFACTGGENKMSNSNEMIERVAKAIVKASHMPFEPMICERIAVAAIEAMKEPTEAMYSACGKRNYAVEYYKLMIEAALKDV